jgi:hypothetical protein
MLLAGAGLPMPHAAAANQRGPADSYFAESIILLLVLRFPYNLRTGKLSDSLLMARAGKIRLAGSDAILDEVGGGARAEV